MITIEPIIINDVNLRFICLKDNTSYFLFEFINTITNEVKTFTTADVSPAKCNYHTFQIVNDTPEDFYTGIVDLDSGFWTYTVYEMPEVSPLSLDKNDALQIVDYGKVLVNKLITMLPTNIIPKVVIPTNKI